MWIFMRSDNKLSTVEWLLQMVLSFPLIKCKCAKSRVFVILKLKTNSVKFYFIWLSQEGIGKCRKINENWETVVKLLKIRKLSDWKIVDWKMLRICRLRKTHVEKLSFEWLSDHLLLRIVSYVKYVSATKALWKASFIIALRSLTTRWWGAVYVRPLTHQTKWGETL